MNARQMSKNARLTSKAKEWLGYAEHEMKDMNEPGPGHCDHYRYMSLAVQMAHVYQLAELTDVIREAFKV